MARGDEADEALKNAALGYVGGKGTQFLGNKIPGVDKFLSGVPVAGDFIKGGMDKDIFSTAFTKGKEFLGMDQASQVEKTILKNQKLLDAIDASDASEDIKKALKQNVLDNVNMGASAEDNLLSLRNILGLGTFAKIFGDVLSQDSDGPSLEDFMVTTDTDLKGFDKPTEIKNVRNFADGGIVSLAEGGFPRKMER